MFHFQSGLNFIDLMVRQGVIDNPPKAPFTMGFECSGEIEAIGENVSNFAVWKKNKDLNKTIKVRNYADDKNNKQIAHSSWPSGNLKLL